MTDFKGSQGDAGRIRALSYQREKELQELLKKKQEIKKEAKAGVAPIQSKFAATRDSVEEQLKQQTVGLVSFQDFKRKRENIERQIYEEQERQRAEQENKVHKSRIVKSKLSFEMDEEEEEQEETPKPKRQKKTESKTQENEKDDENEKEKEVENGEKETTEASGEKEDTEEKRAKIKWTKNPYVDTSFLPDREREEEERRMRQKLAEEWEQEQERIKNQIIEVTYSYYDGTGHRRSLKVKKGTRIDQFLEMVRQEFHELRGISAEHLMFIKEDVILPMQYSFYDLIVNKARGKSGPLWNWDVHEDVRVVSDATKEKDESHAAKVVERRWYERNKHIFPASRWEVYDPTVQRDRYTIHGS